MKKILILLICLLIITIAISCVSASKNVDNFSVEHTDLNHAVEMTKNPVDIVKDNVAGEVTKNPVDIVKDNVAGEVTKNPVEIVKDNVAGEVTKNPVESATNNVEKPKIDIFPPKMAPSNYDNIKAPDFNKPISYKYLKNEVDNAKPGSTLELSRNYRYSGSGDKYISLDKSITIDGKGHYIDGAGEAQIFKSTADNINVVLKNIIFKNAKNEGFFKYNAGAALYNENANLKVINCQFLNNIAGKGPAIYSERPVSIESSRFENNWAKNYGGAVYTEGYLTISGSTFKHNKAETEDGGAVYCNGNMKVRDSTLSANTARVDGGAIYCAGRASVINSVLDFNRVENAKSRCFGGAIRARGGCGIDSSTFGRNYAEDHGGAVYSDREVILTGANRFLSNEAKRYGGAIYSKGIVKINWDEKNPQETIFRLNGVKKYAGGAIYSEGKVLANKGTFYLNQADTDGGAIYANGDVMVRHCNFDSNSAKTAINQLFNVVISNYGGAIKSEGSVTVDGSTLSHNHADYGGAVYADGETTIRDSAFEFNGARHNGGAVHAKTLKEVSGSTFEHNRADGQGGAIYIKDKCDPKFVSSTFKNNHAGKEGGAIFINRMGSEADISYCVFMGNTAKAGQNVYNCGHYKQVHLNWYGSNNPNLKDAFKTYELKGSDKDYNVMNHLTINAKVNESELHMNNTYKLSTYFKASSGELVHQDLIKYKGWHTNPMFKGADVWFKDDGMSDRANMREKMTDNEYSIEFKVTGKNPILCLEMDNQKLNLTPEVTC